MTAGTQADNGILERLAKILKDKSVPPIDCLQCGRKDTVTLIPGLPKQQSFGGGSNYTFGICCECGEICGLEIMLTSLEGDLSARAYGFPRPLIAGISPKQRRTLNADDIIVPPHMPDPINSLFRQARHNLVLRNWDAAGMTYRKTIEISLRTKFGIERGNLASVIEQVSKSQPPMLEVFAWLVRNVGNVATHEAQFSEAEAVLLDSFVEQLVVYLFTVPGIKLQATG